MNIVLDIETDNLAINTNINYVGCYSPELTPNFIAFRIPEEIESFKKFLDSHKDASWGAHNGKFDVTRLLYSYNIDITLQDDSAILGYLCSTVTELKKRKQTKWLNLKSCAQRELGVEDWDVGLGKKTSKEDKDVLPYLEKDCKYCYQLIAHYRKKLPVERRKTYKLMMLASNAYKYLEVTGLPIDMEQLEVVHADFKKQQEDVDKVLLQYADINYNSPTQLRSLLFEQLQLPIIKYTDAGNISTDEETLKELLGEHPIIDVLLEKRYIQKSLDFLTAWKKNAVETNGYYRLHSTFNLYGTVTGRTSSSEVNLQQIPRDKHLKPLFRALEPGWELICMDYSQLELRFAALVANVLTMKTAYRNGEDLHRKLAAVITNKQPQDVTKEERTEAKPANFGYLYGMSAKSFVSYAKTVYGVVFSLEDAIRIRTNYFEAYPELIEYYAQVDYDMRHTCKTTSIMQREYEVDISDIANPYRREETLRAAKNFPVQSSGSDYVVCGLIEAILYSGTREDIKYCATVHDSVIFMLRKNSRFYTNLQKIKNVMEAPQLAKQLLTIDVDIPIIVDIEIGPLGKGVDIEEYKEKYGEFN